jgi:hypothetical protein
MEKTIAGIVIVLLIAGLSQRRLPQRHILLMASAIAIDLALVLYLELTREVIERTLQPMSGLLVFHISVATIVLILYGSMVGTGIWNYRTGGKTRYHRWMALVCVLLRVSTFITSFLIVPGS